MTVLYAWAIPANVVGKFADHTWATTYDCRRHAYGSLDAVAQAQEHLWMCWGSFHPRGGAPGNPDGLLGSTTGALPLAECLVRSNADSVHVAPARGTVQLYGIDGVCHQVANQALFPTGDPRRSPLTVRGSRGYTKSIYVYLQYGRARSAWAAKVRGCTHTKPGEDMTRRLEVDDDFIARARLVLSGRADLLDQVLAMRGEYHAELDALGAMPGLSAEEIDRRHDEHLRHVAEVTGRERFLAIFEQEPDDQVDLVDPEVFAASRAGPPPPAPE